MYGLRRKVLTKTKTTTMHISEIYLQDNFVPNIVEDQFRRKVIGIKVFLNEGDNLDEAKETAEAYIKDYIQKNTHYPQHLHVEERYIPENQLPVIEKEEIMTDWGEVIDHIDACKTVGELKGWQVVAMGNLDSIRHYTEKLRELLPA